MTHRITFLAVTLFWLTMSYLLWQTEYVGHNEVGSSVPVELVWRKILTAPDNSPLEIRHNGKRVGNCRWSSDVGQELASGKILSDDASPEDMAPEPVNNRLNLVGTIALTNLPSRLSFDSEIKLSTNDVWQSFHLRLTMKPTTWEIFSSAADQTVRLVTQDREGRFERVFKFADLEKPQTLMQDFDLPALSLLGMINPLSGTSPESQLSLGLHWSARNDWIVIGHTSIRAYRLEATVLERYRMVIIVNGVGEILRVELPDDWELVNSF
jgi:hypothetical protein